MFDLVVFLLLLLNLYCCIADERVSPLSTDKTDPAGSMQLDVWASLEAHLSFLNDHDIIADFFQGFDGGTAVSWRALKSDAKRWWISYVIARLAPFANIGGFVFKWETPGDDPHGDLELANLLRELDLENCHRAPGLAL